VTVATTPKATAARLQPDAVAGAPSHREGAPLASFSILFDAESDHEQVTDQPSYFTDLNINQIVDGIVAGRDEYDLRTFFNAPLRRVEAVQYRNAVFRDLCIPAIDAALREFAGEMRLVRAHLEQIKKLSEIRQKQAWLLDAIDHYCSACIALGETVRTQKIESQGLARLVSYLDGYSASTSFEAMHNDVIAIKADLAALRYKVIVEAGSFTVQRYEGEVDYSADVLDTFARFKQGNVKDHHSGKFHEWPTMNNVEEKIIEFVSLLYPEPFGRLAAFCERNADFRDPVLQRFDHEIQFYAGFYEYIRPLTGAPLCYPQMSTTDKAVSGSNGYDLALAVKLAKDGGHAVSNSFDLHDNERILVVSGPNQGGKTTFARMFGQMHYLGAMGCPVPGDRAKLHLFDALYTHFEREESIETLSGKLQDDLTRVRDILSSASSHSVVILNEIFTSTSLADALFLSKRVIADIIRQDMIAVWVTFVDELSRLGPETVSMVSAVVAEDPTRRTFKIERRPADGKSYAITLAKKHGLTYERILERVPA
jgi:DNA mismatch repair protein MutS